MGLRIRRGSDEARANTSLEQGELVWTSSQGTTGANYHQLWVGTGVGTGGVNILETSAGYGLSWDATTQRLEVSGLTADDVANGVNNKYFSTELAQDAAASLFTTGTHTNIQFQYDDNLGKINATVTLDGIGLTNIVDDTSPQLGGNLDLNEFDVTGTGNIDITGDISNTGTLTVTGDVSLTGNLENGSLIVSDAEIYASGITSTNARLSFDANVNLIGKSINLGAGNETTAYMNIYVSSTSGNLKVLEDAPLHAQVVFAHNGVEFVESGGISYGSVGTITTGDPSVPMNLTVFLGNGTDALGSGPGIFSFNNDGSFVAPVVQTGVYTATPETRPTGVKGMIIFNDTTGKFQGFNGSTWVDLS